MEKIIEILFFAWLVVFPFGQLAVIPGSLLFGLPEVHILLIDLLTMLIGIVWFVWRLSERKKRLVLPVLGKPLLAFLLFAGLSLVLNAGHYKMSEVMVSSFYFLRLAAYFLLYFALSDLKQKVFTRDKVVGFLTIVGLMSAIFGLVQYFLWPDITFLQTFGWDQHYYRALGTFFDPGFLGIILVLTLVLLSFGQDKNKKGFFFYLAVLLVFLCLMLTYSRSSYLALIGGLLWFAAQKKKLVYILIGLAILSLAIIALPRKSGGEGVHLERVQSTIARFGNWQQSVFYARQSPVFGIGYNTLRYFQKNTGVLTKGWDMTRSGAGVDSSLLFVLVTTGLFGFGAYLWLWISSFRAAMRLNGRWKGIVLGSFIALIIHSFFQNSLFYPWVLGWWVAILALV